MRKTAAAVRMRMVCSVARLVHIQHGGTPLLRTPWGLGKVFCIERCPHFRGRFTFRKHVWVTAKCPQYRDVLISGVSFKRGSTVFHSLTELQEPATKRWKQNLCYWTKTAK